MHEFQHRRVPTIGLQPKQVTIDATMYAMVITCDCGSPTPILIPSVDRAGLCTRCKTKYVISSISFKNDGGLITVSHAVAKWNGPVSASKELDVELTTSH